MAKYSSTLAQVKVYIDGKEQAKKVLEELIAKADEYKKAIADSNKKLTELAEQTKTDPKKVVDYENERKNLLKLEREYKKVKRSISETEKLAADIEKDLDNMSNLSLSRLRTLERQLKAIQSNLKPKTDPNGTFLAFLNDSIQKVSDAIKSRRREFVEFETVMAKITHLDDRSLDAVIKRLKDLIATTDKLDGDKIIRYTEQLAFAEETKRQRTLKSGKGIIARVQEGSFTGSIEQTKEAIKLLENYKNSLKTTDTAALKEVEDTFKELNANLDEFTKKLSRETLTTNLQTVGTSDIKQAVDWLAKYQGTLEPFSQEWREVNTEIEEGNTRLKQLTDTARMEAMSKQFTHLKKLSVSAYEEQKKYWTEVKSTSEEGTDAYKTATANLKKMQKLEAERTQKEARSIMRQTSGKDGFQGSIAETEKAIELLKQYRKQLDATGDVTEIQKVEKAIASLNSNLSEAQRLGAMDTLTKNLGKSSTSEIKQAVDVLTKYRDTLKPLSPEWQNVNDAVEAGTAKLKEYTDSAKLQAMTKQFADLKVLSVSAFAEQKKYWEGIRDSVAQTDPIYQTAIDNLKQIADLEKSRKEASAGAVMGNLGGSSVAQIREAIKATEELRDSVSRQDPEWSKFNKQIENAKAHLEGFETEAKKTASMDVLTARLDVSSTKEIKDSVDFLTKYRDTLEPLSPKWQKVNDAVEAGTAKLKEYTDSAKLQAMTKQFADLKVLSVSAFAEQKKYWEGICDSVAQTDPIYQTAIDNLKQIKELEADRTKGEAKQVIADVKAGTFDKTIEETQQAIKLIEEYKKQLKTSNIDGIQEANDAIAALNLQLGKGKEGLMDYNKAMDIAKQVAEGTFDGTTEDIARAKKALEEYRKTLKQKTDAGKIQQVDEAMRKLGASTTEAGKKVVNLDNVLNNLDTASVEELQSAAKELQDKLSGATRGTEEYIKTAAKLRDVNLELKKAKKEWEGQENVVSKTAKRLAAYVAVYGGFNEIIGKMKEIVQLNLQLSDSLADVQKTTGLTGVELQELGRSLERIDTRTATTELYNLAAAAGQIGLKTQEDVLGFAKAANTISVALNELGAEGSATLTKIATLTGDVARSGTEQALMKVGSAINELTANSAATAGPIADFISRVGGIASASGIAIHEMAALGAATDASAQSIEIAGTSMNKFISALVSNTENIAYATNLNAQELQTLINEGNTMQAVIRVLESMKTMDRGAMSGAMKELGSEGARMNQYIASMVSNLDLLKRQLNISREAFEENTSVLNEYNVKQESAMGILQRMKNAFMDTFVNSKMTVILKDILETIAAIPDWLEKHRAALLAIRIVIAQILVLKLPLLLASLAKQLWGMYSLLSGPMLAGITAFRHAWRQAELELVFTGKACNALTISLRTLGNVIKAHPIMFVASVVTAGLVAWYHFREETDKVAKATAELTQKHTRQIEELNALRTALDATNTSYAVKAAAMREINSLYSKYLGFELSELDTYEKKKAALDYINAKLKENQTLEMIGRQKEVYNEEFSKDTKGNIEGLTEGLMAIPEIGAKRLTEAMTVINEAIKNGASSAQEVIDSLEEHFKVNLSKWAEDHAIIEDSVILDWLEDDPYEDLEEYVQKYSTLQQQLLGSDEYFNAQKVENQRTSDEALEELAVAHQNKIQALEANHQEKLAELEANGAAMTEAEQIEHLQTLLKEQEQYQKTAEQMLQRARERDEKFISEQTNEQGMIDLGNMHAKYGGTETGHIVSSRVNELNAIRTEMAKVRKQIADEELALEEANEKLRQAQQKENNDAEIQAAKETVEAKKKAINDGNAKIISEEMKWNSKYAELQTWATSDARKKWSETTEEIGRNIRSLQIQIAGDPWGKAFDLKDWKQFPELIEGLEDASVTSLVQGFEKLRDNTKLITKDVDAFNKMFDLKTPLKDLDEVNTQVFRWLAQIRAELKSRDRNTSGAPIFTNAKQELDAVLDNLKAHFVKRQNEIRKAYIDGTITSAEMDRRISENDRVFVNERIELRKMLLGENSNFLQELYPELADTDLVKLRLDLQALEDGVTDDLRNSLEEDEKIVTENAIKIRKALEKELLANNPFGTLRDNFRDSLDALSLMTSDFEREQAKILNETFKDLGKNMGDEYMGLDEESQQERLDFLIEMSKKSYTVDRDGLRKMFESHGEYYNWVTHLDDQQMDVMLAKLQWFYDESLLKQKAYADRLIKAQESSYEQQGLKLDDAAKIEWQIENLEKQRNALIAQNTLGDITDEQYKTNEDAIISHTQAINRLEADLLDARKKSADKAKSFRNKQERETKEQMEASISALDAYYNEMEAMIRQRGVERNLTEEEIERQIMENNIARQKDMIQLRKKLLGDPSTFDPFANEGYKGAITGNVFFGDNRNEENLARQAEQIKIWGKALTDGMRNQIAKSNIEIQKEAQKLKESIRKILLDKQYVQQAVNEMRESFGQIDFVDDETQEKLNFLWGNTEQTKRTQEAANERMKILQAFSEDVYSEEADAFKERLLQDATFGESVKKMDKEEYAAFIVLLQQYHDKVISAEKRHADERKRIIDQVWEEEGYQSGYDAAERTIGIAETNLNTMQNAGAIANEQEYFDQYQQLVLNRVALEQWAYEQKLELYKKNNATQEQFQQLDLDHAQKQQQFQQQLLDNYIARYQKMADVTTSYGNIIGDGFGRMLAGEEDAGKQLIKNLLTETIQMASQFAQRLILQNTFGAQMEAIRATQNTAQLAAAYATAMSEVGIEASKMAAIEAIAAGEITAQSMAQPDSIVTWGGTGAARAAVIIGLVAAATAAALALVNSLFPESKASETSTRKLSTGMLTYADGNYPVLGNDGKVYDAKYEGAGMKTGVYGGGAHFGIFSEKQPEMIVDGKTTQKLILNYPYIYDAITTIAKNGRLVNAMPTFATGDYPAGMQRIAQVETVDATGGDSYAQIQRMSAALEQSNAVIARLNAVLTSGQISANVDPYANSKATKRAERFMKRRGIG